MTAPIEAGESGRSAAQLLDNLFSQDARHKVRKSLLISVDVFVKLSLFGGCVSSGRSARFLSLEKLHLRYHSENSIQHSKVLLLRRYGFQGLARSVPNVAYTCKSSR